MLIEIRTMYMDIDLMDDNQVVTMDLEGNNIVECVESYLRNEHEMTEEQLMNFREMVETGKWYGGEWIKKGDNSLRFNTDNMTEQFTIIK